MEFYTYAYLREDGTPYYIGKGKDKRLYSKCGRTISTPPKDRIIKLKDNLTEEEAFRHEVYMIGILPNLRNRTLGGEGISGYVKTQQQRENHRVPNGGKNKFFERFISPDGMIYETNHLREFCREHDLDFRNLSKVHRGQRASHKGWRLSQ